MGKANSWFVKINRKY